MSPTQQQHVKNLSIISPTSTSSFFFFFFCIRPPQGLLPVLGPLMGYMAPTLDAALQYVVHRDRVTTSLVVDNVHRASPLYL